MTNELYMEERSEFLLELVKRIPLSSAQIEKIKNNFLILKIFDMEKQDGYYLGKHSQKDNEISVKIYNKSKSTIFHEFLHVASDSKDNKCTGFRSHTKDGKSIGTCFNEGYTELLNKRMFSQKYPEDYEDETTYIENLYISKIIENLIGYYKMANLYLDADLENLIYEVSLKSGFSIDTITTFIKDLDSYLSLAIVEGDKRYNVYRALPILISITLTNYKNKQNLSDEEKITEILKQIDYLLKILESRISEKSIINIKAMKNIDGISISDIEKTKDMLNLREDRVDLTFSLYYNLLRNFLREVLYEKDYARIIENLYNYNLKLFLLFDDEKVSLVSKEKFNDNKKL